MLLEALIAILVFSLGILTVISIQATSIKLAADAQLRTKAALLADRLVGQMWTHGGDIGALKAAFESPDGSVYTTWLGDVSDFEHGGLPGVVAGDEFTQPEVTVSSASGLDNAAVIVTLYWRTPSMPANERHKHTVTSHISRNL
jgi:type IV pilus assembly protein PilV